MNPISRAQHATSSSPSQEPDVSRQASQGIPEDEARVARAIALHLACKEAEVARETARSAARPSSQSRPGFLFRLARWLGLR